MLQAYSPNGVKIKSQLQRCVAESLIQGFDDLGDPIYDGTTQLFDEEQTNYKIDGQEIFLDENNEDWPYNKLVFK